MKQEDFEKIQNSIFNEVAAMGASKGQEYASNYDRFSNFKEVAADIGVTPVQVLMVFVTKHIRSLEQYARSGKVFSDETTHSRIIDIITYMTLLAGLLIDLSEEKSEEAKAINWSLEMSQNRQTVMGVKTDVK
jgi:hypothetical protein